MRVASCFANFSNMYILGEDTVFRCFLLFKFHARLQLNELLVDELGPVILCSEALYCAEVSLV